MNTRMKFVSENLFGDWTPTGTAQENFDCFVNEWGIDELVDDEGNEITVADIQEYFDLLSSQK